MNDVLLDIGLDATGAIVLRIHDPGVACETEIVMSIAEAQAFITGLEQAIAAAAAVPEGRHINIVEGRA